MSGEREGLAAARGEMVAKLADAVNQLAMHVELLACNTPSTVREIAVGRRRDVREACRRIREDIAELIPE